MEVSDFKFKTVVHVRFNEVDMLGVCNNAVYIAYFEHSRIQYLKEVGLFPKDGLFADGRLYYIVRNEVDYLGHAFFDEELNVYTKIAFMKNSSFGFDHIVEKASTKEVISKGSGVIVHVDPETKKSAPLPDFFYEKIKEYEPNVKIIKK